MRVGPIMDMYGSLCLDAKHSVVLGKLESIGATLCSGLVQSADVSRTEGSMRRSQPIISLVTIIYEDFYKFCR